MLMQKETRGQEGIPRSNAHGNESDAYREFFRPAFAILTLPLHHWAWEGSIFFPHSVLAITGSAEILEKPKRLINK